MSELVRVDPCELRRVADGLDGEAGEFAGGHQRAYSAAELVRLGSGVAGAALVRMLAGWEADAVRFGQHFSVHAEGHRTGAVMYAGAEDVNVMKFGDTGL